MADTNDHIHVGPERVEPHAGQTFVGCDEAGAVVQFIGTVRNHNDGLAVTELIYESYREMAEAEIGRIVKSARSRWNLLKTHTVHRVGRLEIGEAAVCVTVASAHREEAFAACRFIIDELKERAPIWKQEMTVDGSARWVESATPRQHSES